MRILKRFHSAISSLINKLLFLIEVFLFLRLVLKFLGANPEALVVNLIYKYSYILIFPFNLIFSNLYWRGHLIEVATFSAMIGYAILVFVIFEILKLFYSD